jgi:hypothetical protein
MGWFPKVSGAPGPVQSCVCRVRLTGARRQEKGAQGWPGCTAGLRTRCARNVTENAIRQPRSAVVGSMIVDTADTRLAGKPP